MTEQEYRNDYAEMARFLVERHGMKPAQIRESIREMLVEELGEQDNYTPAQWVDMLASYVQQAPTCPSDLETAIDFAMRVDREEGEAQRAREKAQASEIVHDSCPSCQGSGIYAGAHSSGRCYRCAGKGYQDAGDVARNSAYDYHRATRVYGE
jgi:hypothetical protein